EDGSSPQGLAEGSDGALYGTTRIGGRPSGDLYPLGSGTVFKVNKDGGRYAVLHSFVNSEGDGCRPMTGLLVASDGALYGTTDAGGSGNGHNGTVFKLNPDGSG